VTKHAAVSLAFVALVVAAPAAAQKADPCARFEAPLAYNACLAEHGPRAPGTRAEAPGDEGSAPLLRGPRGRRRLDFGVGD
jgi:hypothetical protein